MALTRPRYSQIYDTDYKQSVRVATTEDVGNLLVTGNMTDSVDGKTLSLNDRILVKDQNDAKQNGIYYVSVVGTGSNGTWVRAKDANASDKMTSGMTTIVSEGVVNASKTFRLSTLDPITLGTTELTFINPFTAGSAGGANTYVQINDTGITSGFPGLTFDKASNLLTVTGNISSTSGYFLGNGSQLTGIDATSIQNGTSNVKTYGSSNVTISSGGVANVIVVGSTDTYIKGNVLPTANVTYDLGSPTQRWRTGYFSSGTIDLGGSTISVTATGFVFNVSGSTTPVTLASSGALSGNSLSLSNTTPATTTSSGALVVSGGAGIAGNIVAGSLYSDNHNFANGTSVITTLSSAIVTANTNMKGYVDGQVTSVTNSWQTNAGAQADSISSLQTNKANIASPSFSGNVTITGNLSVAGTQTTFNSNNLTLNDSLLYLAHGNSSDVLDIGLVSSFDNGTYQHGGFVRDASDGVWKLFANVVTEPTTTIDFTNAIYGDLRAGNVTLKGLTVSGAGVDLNSSSTDFALGLKVGKYITGQSGSKLSITNSSNGLYLEAGSNAILDMAGTSVQFGQSTGTGTFTVQMAVTDIQGTQASTSTTTGALKVAGGVGIGGNLYAGNVQGTNLTGTLLTAAQTNITSVGTLGSLSVTGNVSAANVTASSGLYGTIKTAAQTSITSVGTLTALSVSGQITSTQATGTSPFSITSTTVNTNLNADLWDGYHFSDYLDQAVKQASTPTFGGLSIPSITHTGTTGVGNIGASGAAFNTVFAKSTSAQYADLAEIYVGDKHYVPGTVVVFGGDKEVTVSTTSHDPSVAGVVSTNPAYLMNDSVDGVAVALQGRVPCRVLGPVSKGDRVVSSDVRGVAERLDMTKYQPGCIIGKALEAIPDNEIATIEVVVGRV